MTKYIASIILLWIYMLPVSCNKMAGAGSVDNGEQNNLDALTGKCARIHKQGKYDSLIILSKKGLLYASAIHKRKEISIFSYYLGIGFEARQQSDSAIYYFRVAEEIAQLLANTQAMVNVQVQLSGLYYDYGKPDSVAVYKNKMTGEADTMRDVSLKIELKAKLADIYAKTTQPQNALKTYFEVLAYAASKNDSLKTGLALLGIAAVHAQLSEFEQSVNYSTRSIPYLKNSPHKLMVSYNDLGSYYMDLKEYHKAIDAFQRCMDAAGRFNDIAYLKATYVSMASPLIALRQYEKANDYLNNALRYYNGNKYELGFLYVELMLGKMEAAKDKPAKATAYFERALLAAKKTGHFDSESYIYSLLAAEANKTGAHKKAYQYQASYNKLRDSVNQTNTERDIADLEVSYQSKVKEQKIALLDEAAEIKDVQIRDEQRKWWALFAMAGFLAAIAFLLYRSYRLKKKSNKLLEKKNLALNLLNEQLKEANSSKTKLFSILSHDLRVPISGLFQFLNLRKNSVDELNIGQQRNANAKIINSAEHLMDSMEDMLIWSKSQMDSFSMNLKSVNALAVVESSVKMYKDFADERKLTIETHCPPEIVLQTDANFLKVVIRNILSNAIKFTPHGGHIKISAKGKGGWVYFSVSDNGAGINDDQIKSLFEWNSILSDTSGLGLRLAKEFTTRLGGTIMVESGREGATFIISVPAMKAVLSILN